MITQEDFNHAVKQYSDRLYRFMLKLVNNTDDAQNWVQEAFTILWEKKDTVNPERVKSFLFTTAYRKMIDSYRREKNHARLHLEIRQPTATEEDSYGTRQLLQEVLNRVKTSYKTIILLRDYEGYDYESIAEITGTSLSSVKVNLFRARKQVKEKLAVLLNENKLRNEI